MYEKTRSAPSVQFHLSQLSHPGREAKENIIFFVALRSTKLSAGLAEVPTGLRRLAAARCSLRALLKI